MAEAAAAKPAPPLAQPLIDHRLAIEALCREHGVERLEVFGSAADGRFDASRSDLDLIATFSDMGPGIADRYFAFADALERLLRHRVDLLTNHPIRNPYFRKAVQSTRRDLYARPAAQAPR